VCAAARCEADCDNLSGFDVSVPGPADLRAPARRAPTHIARAARLALILGWSDWLGGIDMLASIAGLPLFLYYFVASLILIGVYCYAYQLATAHNELALIRANVPAAGVSFGLSLVGFAVPLSTAMRQSASIWDMLIWGVIAMIVQIMVYFLVRLVLPDLSARIERNEFGAALFVGAASLAAGVLNATAMSY
jgi:putative membrane protein